MEPLEPLDEGDICKGEFAVNELELELGLGLGLGFEANVELLFVTHDLLLRRLLATTLFPLPPTLEKTGLS